MLKGSFRSERGSGAAVVEFDHRGAAEQLADPHGDVTRGREAVDALIAEGLIEQIGERLRAVVRPRD